MGGEMIPQKLHRLVIMGLMEIGAGIQFYQDPFPKQVV